MRDPSPPPTKEIGESIKAEAAAAKLPYFARMMADEP
jgi:hypothetical protein